ncbi:MAG TPA: type VII secretion-associated protein [Mycobacterium sp.]|nr:type VII secretion-associated protein [Mycobacterium sp.]
MNARYAVIEAGPGTVRRLCCGTGMVGDAEMARTALDAIDDPVALVDERPVSVDWLWRAVLRSLDCGRQEPVVLVHPSWWATPRVDVVAAAARILTDDVVTRRRSWLLAHAASDRQATVVVEIAERLVVVTGAAVVAEPRHGDPHRIAEVVAHLIVEMTRDTTAAVLIDAPSAISGAAELATLIASAVRGAGVDSTVVAVDDARLQRLAMAAVSAADEQSAPRSAESACDASSRHRNRVLAPLLLAGVALAAAVPAVGTFGSHHAPSAETMPTTFLVEGRIAVTVPAQWPMQRVVAGPGSARVQVTSPSDPEVALHVTQSPVAGETLSGTAESLKRAIDAEPPGVFVDFNPAGHSTGRPAVTYREVRAGHDIRWTVLLDGTVRIGVGCQSRPGGEDAVRDVCEQAVRSARALERAPS